MIVSKTALAAALVAGLVTATAVRPADACGPYDDESAVDWAAASMFSSFA